MYFRQGVPKIPFLPFFSNFEKEQHLWINLFYNYLFLQQETVALKDYTIKHSKLFYQRINLIKGIGIFEEKQYLIRVLLDLRVSSKNDYGLKKSL